LALGLGGLKGFKLSYNWVFIKFNRVCHSMLSFGLNLRL
jgi:hypothetical protein